jgi:cellobiose-specific phosphotransferase system component IIB
MRMRALGCGKAAKLMARRGSECVIMATAEARAAKGSNDVLAYLLAPQIGDWRHALATRRS